MNLSAKITPYLWYDSEALEVAEYYVGIFPNSKILSITYFTDSGKEYHGNEAGSVMDVLFELDGVRFGAINGGPMFHFSEATSFMVECQTQDEVDYYWERLGAGGDESAQVCGWLKDRYGLSWQIVPKVLFELMQDKDTSKAKRVSDAMLKMKKLDIKALVEASNIES